MLSICTIKMISNKDVMSPVAKQAGNWTVFDSYFFAKELDVLKTQPHKVFRVTGDSVAIIQANYSSFNQGYQGSLGRVVMASDLKSDSLWECGFESRRLRNFFCLLSRKVHLSFWERIQNSQFIRETFWLSWTVKQIYYQSCYLTCCLACKLFHKIFRIFFQKTVYSY